MKGFATTIAIIGVLVIAGMLLFIYTGRFNVAATQRPSAIAEWILETTMEASVRYHARGVVVPDLDDSSMVIEGAEHFQEECVLCHGAPGMDRSDIGEGLNPPPPDLTQEAREWTAAELFWIVQNGIRMTGMPAFGLTHADKELWAVTAFVRRLPAITAEDYRVLTEPAASDSLTVPSTPER